MRETPAKVGFTCGAFDLMHAGHMLMLEDARSICDKLIVAVQSDPSIDRQFKNRPVQSFDERIIMVDGCKYVDEIILYHTEEDLLKILKDIKPDVRILGSDYRNKTFTGQDLPIRIYYHNRQHGWSSSALRERVYYAERRKDDI
jgi:glycerol-3-phosphate cytidylyltransferase